MAEVYIGLGSNIDQPAVHLARALVALDQLPSTRLTKRSSLYQSSPQGPPNQPDYLNAVVALTTALKPLILLNHLHSIERRQRRVRLQKWGPRTLDLDILLYGKMTYRSSRLTIPHPMLHKRNFVLVPLNEINPDLLIPGKGQVGSLVNRLRPLKHSRLRKLSDM